MALARQRVRPDVHLQRAQAHVHFLAVLAREGLFRLAFGSRAVELLVLGQTGVSGVGFAAVGALVPRRRRRRRGRRGGRRRRQGRGRGTTRRTSDFLDLRVHDRGAGRRASSGRSAAVAAGGREILRRDWRWRSERSGAQRTRRREAAVIGAGPVTVTSGDRSLNRRTGERGAVRWRRDRWVMLRRRVRIRWYRVGRIELSPGVMIVIGRRIR